MHSSSQQNISFLCHAVRTKPTHGTSLPLMKDPQHVDPVSNVLSASHNVFNFMCWNQRAGKTNLSFPFWSFHLTNAFLFLSTPLCLIQFQQLEFISMTGAGDLAFPYTVLEIRAFEISTQHRLTLQTQPKVTATLKTRENRFYGYSGFLDGLSWTSKQWKCYTAFSFNLILWIVRSEWQKKVSATQRLIVINCIPN